MSVQDYWRLRLLEQAKASLTKERRRPQAPRWEGMSCGPQLQTMVNVGAKKKGRNDTSWGI